MATSTNLAISGLASGFDWQSLVTQLIQVERAPEDALRTDQAALQQKNNAYGSIKTELGILQNRSTALSDASLYDSRLAQSSDATVATASADVGAAIGSYTFNFTQLATSARQQGAVNVGKPLSGSDDVSGLLLSSAGFTTGVTAGTFTVNGKQVVVAATDTLGQLFGKISDATGGDVTAAYNSGTDTIRLSSTAGEIVQIGRAHV